MKKTSLVFILILFTSFCLSAQPKTDWRNIKHGTVIPDEGYCDQPYVVKNEDGSWTCIMTTGSGHEGDRGQHLVAVLTKDQGKTWSDMIDIEPADGPEASWGMPLKTPYGRIYIFYTYNKSGITETPNTTGGAANRVDTQGAYAFKYSDDNGKTWSEKRYEIPVREMAIDRRNNFKGAEKQFWGVGKPIIVGDVMYFGFAKVGKWGNPGTMITSEGCFMKSDNILTEKDPEKIHWETLPDGDHGLRAPKGPVADEANLVSLGDGSLYCTYRTIDGFNCHAYSRDGGHTWTPPAYATYTPGGRKINHPRAYNPVRKFSNDKYLLWFHNHGGESVHRDTIWTKTSYYYQGRNPVWISGGVEKDGYIHWSQPEILLYDEDPNVRVSYPDFIEEHGKYYVTETQKTVARIHEIDPKLLEAVWNQSDNRTLTREGLVVELSNEQCQAGSKASMPSLPDLTLGGFTIEGWIQLEHLTAGQILLDTQDENGKGIALTTGEKWNLRLLMGDGDTTVTWESDPGTHPGTLKANRLQHIAVVVDGGPNIISFIINGQLNDGGDIRQYGWGRFPVNFKEINGAKKAVIAPELYHDGKINQLRIYNRALLTSEVVGNYQAGLK